MSSRTGIINNPTDRTRELSATSNLIESRIKRSMRTSDYEKLFKSNSFENRLANRFRTIRRSLIEGVVIHNRTVEILNLIESELK